MKLTFAELKIGDRFIAFPTEGGKAGHGGFLKPSYIFTKVNSLEAARGVDAVLSATPGTMPVIRVI